MAEKKRRLLGRIFGKSETKVDVAHEEAVIQPVAEYSKSNEGRKEASKPKKRTTFEVIKPDSDQDVIETFLNNAKMLRKMVLELRRKQELNSLLVNNLLGSRKFLKESQLSEISKMRQSFREANRGIKSTEGYVALEGEKGGDKIYYSKENDIQLKCNEFKIGHHPLIDLIVDGENIISTSFTKRDQALYEISEEVLVEINNKVLNKLYSELHEHNYLASLKNSELDELARQVHYAVDKELRKVKSNNSVGKNSLVRNGSNIDSVGPSIEESKILNESLNRDAQSLLKSRPSVKSGTDDLSKYGVISLAVKHLASLPPIFDKLDKKEDLTFSYAQGSDVVLEYFDDNGYSVKSQFGKFTRKQLRLSDNYEADVYSKPYNEDTFSRLEYQPIDSDIVIAVDKIMLTDNENVRSDDSRLDVRYSISYDGKVIDHGFIDRYVVVSAIRKADFSDLPALADIARVLTEDLKDARPIFKNMNDYFSGRFDIDSDEIKENSDRISNVLSKL